MSNRLTDDTATEYNIGRKQWNLILNDLKVVNTKAGRPPTNMTDEQWQEYFEVLKTLVLPSAQSKMNTIYSSKRGESYDGDTCYTYYTIFINSVLSAIRHGEIDYCYYIYQISELLKYEHERLRTRYSEIDKCFIVWLE